MPRKKLEKLVVDEEEEFEVDEPSEVEELENNATDDDWTPADEEKKPGRPQRAARARKPVKLLDGKTTSDEDDDEEEEEEEEEETRGTKRKRGGTNTAVRGGRGRGRGRPPAASKKAKTDENGKGRGKKKEATEEQPEGEAEEDEMEDVEDEEGLEDEEDSVSEEEESDDDDSEAEDVEIPPEFKSGKFVLLKSDFDNKEENYPLWKIDGKSLLQKFDKFVHNGEELYKGTTIYAGWSKAVIHTYYPITVEHRTVGVGGETTVKFDPSQITPEIQTATKETTVTKPGASGVDKDQPAEEEAEATTAEVEGDGEPEE